MCVLILLAPLLFHFTLSTGAAGWGILIFLTVLSLLAGWVDIHLFRFNWSFPIIVGVVFWISRTLYYSEETWIYAVVFFLLALAGEKLGDRS